MTSATERTLKHLRQDLGLKVFRTEHWNPFAHIRQDLMGFCDFIALGRIPVSKDFEDPWSENNTFSNGILAVQSTVGGEHARHKEKIINNENLPVWKECGGRVLLISWSLLKESRGSKRSIWKPRKELL